MVGETPPQDRSRLLRKYLKLVRQLVNAEISAKRYTFAREPLMAWCEDNHVDYLFGFARNTRLLAMIADELTAAQATAERTDQPARRFKDFQWSFKMNAFWAPENFEPSSFFAPPGRGNREKL
ncbi:transposase [Bradyrhizobium sp. IC4060]|nr:transposase [Bradyrhizobium sp. IC4060]MCA1486537.1 transposase [Bradyrhizobium sp. IC4061]